MSRFRFVIYPEWFGGPSEADKGIVELAIHQATHEQREVADISVNRGDPDKWKVIVEFAY